MQKELVGSAPSHNLISLNQIIKNNQNAINKWVEQKRNNKPWPIYHSLDLRNSGYKICHVDSNLFPAGFNNLSDYGINNAIHEFKKVLEGIKKILIVIENFTRNTAYLENVAQLQNILFKATQAEIKIAAPGIEANTTIQTAHNTIELYQLKKENELAFIKCENQSNWYPDFILLNNDLTSGVPEELHNIAQDIKPNTQFGWHSRKKSDHFFKYNELITELSQSLHFNPFLISTYIDFATDINFRNKTGLELLKHKAENLLVKIQRAYEINKIKLEPYLFLKANSGTFGMGILELQDINRILELNKKSRHSMHAIKSGVLNNQILIQEGIFSIESHDYSPSESIIYSVDGSIVGEIIRYNVEKNSYQSLNSNGMKFLKITQFNIENNLGYIKWLINKMANLACCL